MHLTSFFKGAYDPGFQAFLKWKDYPTSLVRALLIRRGAKARSLQISRVFEDFVYC